MASQQPDGLTVQSIFNLIYIVLHFLNLLFILHNMFRYILGLKMQRPLILTFYTILLIATTLRIIEFILRLIYTEQSDYADPVFLFNQMALFASMSVELTLILTMQRLALGLRLILGEINICVIKRQQRHGIWLTILFAGTFLVLGFYLWIKDYSKDFKTKRFFYFTISALVILVMTYTIVIIKLNQVMKKVDGNFEQEIRSINCQFFFFLIAYLTRIALDIAF